ncbi:hypothetical protein FPOAC1_002076 [Fusarium poae]|uniref:hypothetical protein n=1 Tax=Fusarium poae TaxID=36050 RepID=UPI001CE8ECF7|nr:hypothetical protein FPOAC1_002076 [Fusarium poae]KAG8676080.1 hypothetical protein FPOAC1_002076 [Fusarium poae]
MLQLAPQCRNRVIVFRYADVTHTILQDCVMFTSRKTRVYPITVKHRLSTKKVYWNGQLQKGGENQIHWYLANQQSQVDADNHLSHKSYADLPNRLDDGPWSRFSPTTDAYNSQHPQPQ